MTGPIEMARGRDYVGDLEDIVFGTVDGDASASITWTLYDADEQELDGGSGTFVSAKTYRVVVPASAFASQTPAPGPFKYTTGRLEVLGVQAGVHGAWGYPVRFTFPGRTSA